MTTRHEFLEQLHELLKPTTYLEVGVQHGWSLQLSRAPISIGIDPNPQPDAWNLTTRGDHVIYGVTSDEFFADPCPLDPSTPFMGFRSIDLAFIDGMHLAEFAWRDFWNVARYCRARSVVVLDDVLPTTSEMAAREQCPGDWTGDVWRVPFLVQEHSDWQYAVQWVDTTPTGTCVITGFDEIIDLIADEEPGIGDFDLPAWVIDRRHCWTAPQVLDNLRDRGFAK